MVSQYINILWDGKVQPQHIRLDYRVKMSLLSVAYLKVTQIYEPSYTIDKCY
jgi:hypothetical protein